MILPSCKVASHVTNVNKHCSALYQSIVTGHVCDSDCSNSYRWAVLICDIIDSMTSSTTNDFNLWQLVTTVWLYVKQQLPIKAVLSLCLFTRAVVHPAFTSSSSNFCSSPHHFIMATPDDKPKLSLLATFDDQTRMLQSLFDNMDGKILQLFLFEGMLTLFGFFHYFSR